MDRDVGTILNLGKQRLNGKPKTDNYIIFFTHLNFGKFRYSEKATKIRKNHPLYIVKRS